MAGAAVASTVAAGGHDDVLDDREAEAGAAEVAGGVGAPEALEQARQVSASSTPIPSSAAVSTRGSPARDRERERAPWPA